MPRHKTASQTAAERRAAHAVAGTADVFRMPGGLTGVVPRSDWPEILKLSRELQKQAAIDQTMRCISLAPEMVGLLADCARGEGTFKGASSAVRRLAALDVLAMATGGLLKDAGLQENAPKNQGDSGDLNKRSLSELEEFISAGLSRLAKLDAAKGADDAIVIEQQPDNSQNNS